MPVPKIREHFKFQDNLCGDSPHADPVYALVRRQDNMRAAITEMETVLRKLFTLEVDPSSSSGYSVRVPDSNKKQVDSLLKSKVTTQSGIQKIDEVFDQIDKLMEKHPECEYPKVSHIQNRSLYHRGIISDKHRSYTLSGQQIPIPAKVKSELQQLEAQAVAFDKVASQIEDLCRKADY
jgi:hypothetical protein